jgi:hypothetical protein
VKGKDDDDEEEEDEEEEEEEEKTIGTVFRNQMRVEWWNQDLR